MEINEKNLFLIPVPIIENGEHTIPKETFDVVNQIQYFVVENLKTARRVLRKLGYTKDFDTEVQFYEFDKHAVVQDYHVVKSWFSEHKNIGLLSEAGLPCIADPGNEVVALAHQSDYTIKPLSGPSSIVLALIASGFGGQNFAFNGYLPIDKSEKIAKLRQLENKAKSEKQTQIFMETPYRNGSFFDEILNTLSAQMKLSVAANISAKNAYIKTHSIAE